jgi:hypothetical protein
MAAFTTIAAIGSAAIGSGMSFAEAGKQRKLQQEAEREAQKAFDEAKAQLDVNYLEGLSIAKEPYELEREALLQTGAAALQAGVEGETRGAAATAGQVLMAQQAQAAQQRAAMSREMQQLEQLAAQEESRLQGARADLSLGEAIGQQQRAQQAQQMRQAAMGQAIGGLFDIAGAAIGARGLYADEQAANNKQLRQLRRSPEYNLGQSRAALDLQLQQSIPTTSIFDPMAGLSALPASTLPALGQLKPR